MAVRMLNSARARKVVLSVGLVVLCSGLAIRFTRAPIAEPLSESDLIAAESTIERGRYLADAGNCISCHTVEGGAPFSGGVPIESPLGTIYSTNITPDVDTGIGTWSRSAFRRAMRRGIAADGTSLFPAFPYPSYTKVTDEDIDAIYAYLRTLDPVRATPPDNSMLLRLRWPMRIWNKLYLDEGVFTSDPSRPEQWNRGAYLVEGLGHCGACHTPRNLGLAEIPERALQGASINHEVEPGKNREWFAVDLTPSTHALGAWSQRDLAQYLGTGFSRRAGTFGPMNEVIVNSLMKLTIDDITAMTVYLTSLPAREIPKAEIPAALMELGAPIYEERCEECHSSSGRGGFFDGPPLAGSAIVQAQSPSSLINIVLYGPEMPEEVSFGGWETMKKYGHVLDDSEIAAVANYVRGSWGNSGTLVTAQDVARQR